MQHILDELKTLEDRARKLENQNLADVAASAHGKVRQLSEHPDLELLDEKPPAGLFDPKAPTTAEEAISRKHAEGAPDPAAAARADWPHLFDAPGTGQQPFSPDVPQTTTTGMSKGL